jgi:hypothetical protein
LIDIGRKNETPYGISCDRNDLRDRRRNHPRLPTLLKLDFINGNGLRALQSSGSAPEIFDPLVELRCRRPRLLYRSRRSNLLCYNCAEAVSLSQRILSHQQTEGYKAMMKVAIGMFVTMLLVCVTLYITGPTVQNPQARTVQAATPAQANPQARTAQQARCTENDVQILQLSLRRGEKTRFIDMSDTVNVIGEIKNNCARPVGLVYITVTFRDTAGKIVTVGEVGCSLNSSERCSFHGPIEVGSYATADAKVALVTTP